MRLRSITLGALAAALLTAPAVTAPSPATAAAPYAQIEGTGSTWSDLLLQQWVADVSTEGLPVVYTGGGSSRGLADFAAGTTDFAVTEMPFASAEAAGDRAYASLPLVGGGTAFTYQLSVRGRMVTNLRLSGPTLAKIFTNRITTWADPAIARDNGGHRFPRIPITPVVRSDGSGTTHQLTAWLDAEHPSIWRPFLGHAGATATFPRAGRAVAQAGSDQVMNYVASSAGTGSIGYVEYAYPLDKNYPVVKVRNEAGSYVAPTEYNVAVALTKAKVATDGRTDLGAVYTNPDPRAYPLSSYSSMIVPTGADDPRMTTARRQTIVDFVDHALCAGQRMAGPYGYSPLPLGLVRIGMAQLAKVAAADPGVDLTDRDVRTCDNPTFDGRHPGTNVLATKAPMPIWCDRAPAGPCGTAPGVLPGKPVLDGRAQVGRKLRVRLPRWTGPLPYHFTWWADGHRIGHDGRSLRITSKLVGSRVSVRGVTGDPGLKPQVRSASVTVRRTSPRG